ncbi:MAG: cupin domain-containing protein [Candidatus Hodarchaeota archaeon]
MEERILSINEVEWKSIRSDITEGILGFPLFPRELSNTKITVTRVKQGCTFPRHKDDYHHVFYFIDGDGEGWLGGQSFQISPGLIVQVPAGVTHGYRNTGDRDLLLLTINIE